MPTTSNKQFDVPSHGTEVDTWDTPLNNNFTKIDAILGNTTSKLLSNAPVTLTTTEQQVMAYSFTGTLTADVTITATMPGFYKIFNNCNAGAFVVLFTTGLGGDDIAIPPSQSAVEAYCDGTNWRFANLGRTGMWDFWWTSTLPRWVSQCTKQPFLLMDGSSFSSGTYPQLALFLGGTTLPDMRSYTPIPLDNFGTGAAARIGSVNTGAGTIVGATLGSSGGANTHTLVTAEMPSHTHAQNPHLHNMDHVTNSYGAGTNDGVKSLGSGAGAANTDNTTAVNQNTGGGGSHNNIQISKMAGIAVIKT